MVIENEMINMKLAENDQRAVDDCIVGLTRHISNRSSNISSSRFVLNAIWIRSVFCQSQLVNWNGLWKVTSLKYIECHREAILSFMDTIHFNTLVVTSIARDNDLPDVCKLLLASGDHIPLLPQAMRKLHTIYNNYSSSTKKESCRGISKENKELTMLKLIGRLAVEQDAKQEIIQSVIKDASFESVGTFQGLEAIFSSLSCHHENYGVIKRELENSVTKSLSTWKNRPTLSDVSNLLKSDISWTLENLEGWNALLTNFLREQTVLKRQTTDLVNLLEIIYNWTEDKKSALDQVIFDVVQSTSNHTKFNLAVAFFQLAIDRPDVFTCTDQSHCSEIAKTIVCQTQLASCILSSPDKVNEIPFQRSLGTKKSFAQCLSDELIESLKHQCSKIDEAVHFCLHASNIESEMIAGIASDILKHSFLIWGPLTLQDLLGVDAFILKQAFKLLIYFSQEHQAQKVKSIISRWTIQYTKNAFDTTQLSNVLDGMNGDKHDALVEVSGESFPNKLELEKKISEINNGIQEIRSRLTFHTKKDTNEIEVQISDLAAYFRLDSSGALLSKLVVFFGDTDPKLTPAQLYASRDEVESLIAKYGTELHAAAYFSTNKSVLFQHEIGSWAEISLEDFITKLTSVINKFEILLSPEAKFSQITEASKVLAQQNGDIDHELKLITSSDRLTINPSFSTDCLRHNLTLAKISVLLQSFIDCCSAYKFALTSTQEFSELNSICKQLANNESGGMSMCECYELGCRIADILVPNTDSLDLTTRLVECIPTFEFFDALRLCSSTFQLARERMWFGDEGLKAFYKEYNNVR